jgi:hypothetical protein
VRSVALFVHVYYPGTFDFESARPIDTNAGVDSGRVDFTMIPAKTHRLRASAPSVWVPPPDAERAGPMPLQLISAYSAVLRQRSTSRHLHCARIRHWRLKFPYTPWSHPFVERLIGTNDSTRVPGPAAVLDGNGFRKKTHAL